MAFSHPYIRMYARRVLPENSENSGFIERAAPCRGETGPDGARTHSIVGELRDSKWFSQHFLPRDIGHDDCSARKRQWGLSPRAMRLSNPVRRIVMQAEDLRDLYIDQLKDLYNAETQLIKALPKMAKAASNDELKNAFQTHLEETRVHAQRIEQIMQGMGERPKGKKCKGMEGLVEEGKEALGEFDDPDVLDAALIAAAQRVEHYEIA